MRWGCGRWMPKACAQCATLTRDLAGIARELEQSRMRNRGLVADVASLRMALAQAQTLIAAGPMGAGELLAARVEEPAMRNWLSVWEAFRRRPVQRDY